MSSTRTQDRSLAAAPRLVAARRPVRGARAALLVALLGLGLGLGVREARAESEAFSIAKQALETNLFATENARAVIDMEIQKGGKVVRTRRISTLMSRKNGAVRSFVEFESPADVAGTRFLSVEEKSGGTEQFIYLPAFKKVKRIVGAQRSQSFMGTDFSYADLEGRRVEDATWSKLSDEPIRGEDCHVIEGVSTKADDQYGRVRLWVHKKTNVPLRGEFYDKAGKVVEKRLDVQKLQSKDGRWITTESVMETPKEGSSTRLKVASIDLKTEIPEAALTRQALER